MRSEAQRDHFMQHIRPDLLKFIVESVGTGSLVIETDVADAVQNGRKIYTDQDKLEYLIRKNPELKDLTSRFNLDFDD